MGLAAAGPPLQEQPALQILGVVSGLVVSDLKRIGLPLANAGSPVGLEALKGQRAQFVEVAKREQAVARDAGHLPSAASADEHLAEVRVAHRDILPQIPDAVAVRAVGIAERVAAWFSRG